VCRWYQPIWLPVQQRLLGNQLWEEDHQRKRLKGHKAISLESLSLTLLRGIPRIRYVKKIATLKSVLSIGDQSTFSVPYFTPRVLFKNLFAITNTGFGLAILFQKWGCFSSFSVFCVHLLFCLLRFRLLDQPQEMSRSQTLAWLFLANIKGYDNFLSTLMDYHPSMGRALATLNDPYNL